MIQRIVKMTFQPEKIADFLAIFQQSKEAIRRSKGCHHLELWQDVNSSHIIFTYSIWENEEALDQYRNSQLFADTWSKTKQYFADKPQAWSLRRLHILD